jgi:hypothetical protein
MRAAGASLAGIAERIFRDAIVSLPAHHTASMDDFEDLVRQFVELKKEVARQRVALERLATLLDAGAQLLKLPEAAEEEASASDPANGLPPRQTPLSDRRPRPA